MIVSGIQEDVEKVIKKIDDLTKDPMNFKWKYNISRALFDTEL
jgi:hypothetical protein